MLFIHISQIRPHYAHIQKSKNLPNAHSWARDDWETDGSAETLITLRIIVLETDLEFDGFEEVSLLGLEGVFEETLDVGTHSGCGAKELACVLTGRAIK
jgi:hypothetical protein